MIVADRQTAELRKMGSKIVVGSGNNVTLDGSISLDSGGTASISSGVGRGERQDAAFGRLV